MAMDLASLAFDPEYEFDRKFRNRRTCCQKFTSSVLVFATIVILGLATTFILWEIIRDRTHKEVNNGIFENGAVSCDSPYCATIGKNILERGGSVADSAIAALLCMGVVHSQSMGIGGGFLMTLYNATNGRSMVLNARETAPFAATRDMFQGNQDNARMGGLSVAVPGEIRGYWTLHQAAGIVPWEDLFQPTIDLCEKGFKITKHTAMALSSKSQFILNESSLAEIFVNPETGNVYEEGDVITRKDLTGTFKLIAKGGAKEFYEGELAKMIVEDLQEFGGIITMEDMKNYTAEWHSPIKVKVFGDFTLHSVPPPGSGVLVAFIMKLLGKYQFRRDTLQYKGNGESSILFYHRMIEAFKHAFAKRTELGDPLMEDGRHVYDLMTKWISDEYVDEVFEKIIANTTTSSLEYYGAKYSQSENDGTSHVSILAPNGDAISVTSTINLYFGAMIRSKRTGIIYNDQMDDFSAPNITNYFGVPPSPNNFIQPGKRPVSSMTPTIFTDSMGRVRLVIGTAGGTKITTATALVSMKNLWFGESIKDAIDAPRIHHQLVPMEVQYERDFPSYIVKGLQAIGHNVTKVAPGQSITVAISRECDWQLRASSDYRKQGTVAGF